MSSANDTALKCAREALAAIISAYVAMIINTVDSAKALRLAQKLRGHVRRNLKIIDGLYANGLRAELARDAGFRARVRRDLGGSPAMRAWMERRRGEKVRAAFRAANGLPEPDYSHNAHSPRQAARKLWQAKTDRSGNFRLAVIPTGPRATKLSAAKLKLKSSRKGAVTSVRQYRFKPLEVTAEDLHVSAGFPRGNYSAPIMDDPVPIGHAPPIIRPPI